jgi:hypothetical protein
VSLVEKGESLSFSFSRLYDVLLIFSGSFVKPIVYDFGCFTWMGEHLEYASIYKQLSLFPAFVWQCGNHYAIDFKFAHDQLSLPPIFPCP